MQLDICTHAYHCVGHKQLCCFRCIFVVRMSELLAWINIVQDYTTWIFLGRHLKFLMSKIWYHSSLNSIIKCSEARRRERMWWWDGYVI